MLYSCGEITSTASSRMGNTSSSTNTNEKKKNISLVSLNQANKLINSSKKYVLLFLRENYSREESLKVKTSLEGCNKEYKNELDELIKEYRGIFQEPKGIPPKMVVEHEIQLFLYSPLPNIGLYI
jgi:hypothetical protein